MPFQWSMHNKNTQYPSRKSPRRSSIDYSTAGYYFVTICSYNRETFFGDVVNDQMRLNPAGQAMEDLWADIPRQFNQVKLDAFVIMPNHIHGIIILEGGITLKPCGPGIQIYRNPRVCPGGPPTRMEEI